MAETELAAEEARQQTARRFAEALRFINDVVIELKLASASAADIRRSTVVNASASFSHTFGREIDLTPGLLFQLVDPSDDEELERVLIASSRGPVGGGVAARSSVAFLGRNGSRRRLQLQVVRLQPALQPANALKRSASHSGSFGRLSSRVSSSDGERDGESSLDYGESSLDYGESSADGAAGGGGGNESAGVSLFVVCHDLSDALRQAEREIEQKAHRVLNHTAKRVSGIGSCRPRASLHCTSALRSHALLAANATPSPSLRPTAFAPPPSPRRLRPTAFFAPRPSPPRWQVMANTSQCCRMVIAQLEPLRTSEAGTRSEDDASVIDSAVGLLSTTLSESMTGYHM